MKQRRHRRVRCIRLLAAFFMLAANSPKYSVRMTKPFFADPSARNWPEGEKRKNDGYSIANSYLTLNEGISNN